MSEIDSHKMKLLKELLESFDATAQHVEWNGLKCVVTVEDGLIYYVTLQPLKNPSWEEFFGSELKLFNIIFTDENGNEHTTGDVGHKSGKVFGAIGNAIAPKLTELNVDVAFLVAKEDNRRKLYPWVASKIAQDNRWGTMNVGESGQTSAVAIYDVRHHYKVEALQNHLTVHNNWG